MTWSYDIVVVGGGPAGSSAAMTAAQGGASVLLLEKDAEIGVPVRCAEGVSARSLESLFDPNPLWVSNRITKLSFVAPDHVEVHLNSPRLGCILDRASFDRDVAGKAARAGATVMTGACVTGLTRLRNGDWDISLQSKGQAVRIIAHIVIGADGVESRVGRWAGIDTSTGLHDIETCVQYLLTDLDIDHERCQLHFGREVAPGGYLWVFPKGPDAANVGLGLSGEYAQNKKPVDYLDQAVNRLFPLAQVVRSVGGGVPCSVPIEEPVADGIMLVGDAAHQADSMTGGGIMNAVRAGRLAGQVAAEAIAAGDWSKGRLRAYAQQCDELMGKKLRRSYRLKEAVYKLSDEELNATARALNTIDPEKRTLGRVFITALAKNPRLLPDILALFGS